MSDFTRKVYECSADICLRAGDQGEALKCLRQLDLIYTTLAASLLNVQPNGIGLQPQDAPQPQQLDQQERAPQQQQHGREHTLIMYHNSEQARGGSGFAMASLLQSGLLQRQRAEQRAGAAGPVGHNAASTSTARSGPAAPPTTARPSQSLPQHSELQSLEEVASLHECGPDRALAELLVRSEQLARWPEMAAALLLYYKCCGSQHAGGEDGLDTAITLRSLPRPLLQCREVQNALQLAVALAAGNYVAVVRLLDTAPRAVQLVAQTRLAQVHQEAVVTMAAAYRKVAVSAVAQMLGLVPQGAGRALLGILKTLADKGHRGAQLALSTAQMSEEESFQELIFK
ncbi:hypothetical protein N2152v2_003082 [Parachlorella kessleri]